MHSQGIFGVFFITLRIAFVSQPHENLDSDFQDVIGIALTVLLEKLLQVKSNQVNGLSVRCRISSNTGFKWGKSGDVIFQTILCKSVKI